MHEQSDLEMFSGYFEWHCASLVGENKNNWQLVWW